MISVVVPTFKRSENIYRTYDMIHKTLFEADISYELIFVDDGSKDHTEGVLKKICSEHTEVKGIVLEHNYGQQNATLAGIRRAYDDHIQNKEHYIITFDDDLSYDADVILVLLNEIKKGYKVVYGVPLEKHSKFSRVFGTYFKEFVFKIIMKKSMKIRLTSLRIMDREVVGFVVKDSCEKVYISARTLLFTKNIGNVDINNLEKKYPSNYTMIKLIKVVINLIRYYSPLGTTITRKKIKKSQYVVKRQFS